MHFIWSFKLYIQWLCWADQATDKTLPQTNSSHVQVSSPRHRQLLLQARGITLRLAWVQGMCWIVYYS